MSFALALLLHAIAAFESRTIPLESEKDAVYMGPAEAGGTKSIVVQDGSQITVYALWGDSQPRRAVLPEGVTAFDVADTDDDRQAEVIAVSGTQILRIPLSTVPTAPTTLFTCESVLSGDTGEPYLYPLALRVAGHTGIGLPRNNQVELYSTKGEKTDQFALHSGEEGSSNDDSFNAMPFSSEGALNFHVWQRVEFAPAYRPDTFYYVGATGGSGNRILTAWFPHTESPLDWPWFPIRKVGDEILKAHFCLVSDTSGGPRQETSINIRSLGAQSLDDAENGEGVTYRYPGILVSSWDAPDFNGDGYNDILLARMPRPGGSLSGAIRTLTNGTVPFEATVHLYLPDERRFEPRPTSLIGYRVNVMSLLGRMSADGLIMRDFNGDGRTDLAAVANEKQLVVWLHGENGFSKEPDYTFDSADPLQRVEFVAVLGNKLNKNNPNWCFGVRAERSLVVVFYSAD